MERRAPEAGRSGRQVRLSRTRRAAVLVRAVSRRAPRARCGVAIAAVAIGLAAWAPQALADFPYVGDGTASDPTSWALAPGHVPSNLGGLAWKFAATPAIPPSKESNLTEYQAITQNNSQMDELCGVTGMSLVDAQATFPSGTGSCIAAGSAVKTAFEVTLGRPDVAIGELDSGIKWDSAGDMTQLRKKLLLNTGELPAPRVDLGNTFDPSTGVDCASAHAATGADYNPAGGMPGGTPGGSGPIPYDVAGQGVFNVLDYACDSRVANIVQNYPQCTNPPTVSACRNGPSAMLTPEDLIVAFSDGVDHDHNGYANDIAGWNFVDDTNDPYDDVHYGHGTGEDEDSTAEANVSAGEVGSCPNCTVLPLRVGESFIADANRFAEATIYATDRGVNVVQEALGTYNDPVFARRAIDYAYGHGVAVIASAADEAAEHHNQPGALPHTIVVNAVQGPASLNHVPVTNKPPSYLQIDGCTNFGTRVDLSVPATSCSSEATGKSSGVAGLIYGAALNACGAPLYGQCTSGSAAKLPSASDCTRVDGSPCPITANEVRQLMASGNIADTTVNGSSTLGSSAPSTGTASADLGEGGQADDVNTAQQAETACSVGMAPGCSDPNLNTTFAADENAGVIGPLPDTFRYPSRKGLDEFFGYGRLDAYKSVEAAAQGWVPPQADITSPEWFQQMDPAQASFALDGYVNARTNYTCHVDVAPGAQPNNSSSSAGGDFVTVPSGYCDGTTPHSAPYTGLLASLSTSTLESLFPHGVPTSFTGNENGGPGLAQSSNGRPNTLPYAFTVRVVVSSAAGAPGPAMTGEDRRQLFLHRDQNMLSGFPIEMKGDGDASPVLVDLAGNDTNQLIVANSDGWIHAYRYDPSTGTMTDLPGWPVHTEPLPLHSGGQAFTSGGESTAHYDPVLEAPAAGDLFGDGRMEIVADDLQGNVYAWDSAGHLVFHETSNPNYSGAPLAGSPAWEAQRAGVRQRTEGGFLTSPVLAKLDPAAGPGLDIIAAGEDRHVYAWHANGTAVGGFPVLVEDPNKVASVDLRSNQVLFNGNAKANPDKNEDQGKIVDTPAVAYLDGPGNPPSIIVGTNEEYLTGTGNEGGINAAKTTTASLGLLGSTGVLQFANGRVYAINASGCSAESSSCATGGFSCASAQCTSSAFRAGWPAKIGIIDAGLLPDVGEGINGSPVVAPVTCPEGGGGLKIGVTPDAGPGYVLNADGSSCYGSTEGAYNALETDFSAAAGKTDTPAFPAVGEPSFGTLDGTTTDIFAPVAGLIRALDVIAPDYQKAGQDFTAAWNANSSQFAPGFPAVNNDLSFITGQVIGDVTGAAPAQEVLAGTASQDLQAYNAEGNPASTAWPKLTGDWLVATPILGSLGTLDTSSGAKKNVVSITRSGTLAVYSTPASACSPSSWPNFHHDIANSGDYTRDAISPGVPLGATLANMVLSWTAPGGDLLCGTASSYQIVTSANPITAQNFAAGTPLSGAPTPAAAGSAQAYTVPATAQRYVAIRAIDEQGNIGLPAVAQFKPPAVVTESASSVTQTSATLNATVNPKGQTVSDCHFEYGTTTSYVASVPCSSPPGSGESPVAVSASLSMGSLSESTTYHFRIVATNPSGTSYGSDQMFTTLPNPPTVVTEPASSVTQTSATVNATVSPNGGTVSDCHFDYGTTEAYGSVVPCASPPGSGESPVAVSASVGSLSANTTYHFRIVATNPGGTSSGSDRTFTTLPNPSPPHYYSNGVKIKQGAAVPTISWGTLTLANEKTGEVACENVAAGDIENPVGGGAGNGETEAFAPYDCVSPGCPAEAGLEITVTAEKLPWPSVLEEPELGVFRNKTTGISVIVKCENPISKKVELLVEFHGELKPKSKNGSGVGSKPSSLAFDNPGSGTLESTGGPGTFAGKLKTMGYEGQEIIQTRNP